MPPSTSALPSKRSSKRPPCGSSALKLNSHKKHFGRRPDRMDEGESPVLLAELSEIFHVPDGFQLRSFNLNFDDGGSGSILGKYGLLSTKIQIGRAHVELQPPCNLVSGLRP